MKTIWWPFCLLTLSRRIMCTQIREGFQLHRPGNPANAIGENRGVRRREDCRYQDRRGCGEAAVSGLRSYVIRMQFNSRLHSSRHCAMQGPWTRIAQSCVGKVYSVVTTGSRPSTASCSLKPASGNRRQQRILKWRATVDDDGHYSFAVAL